jgi:hypothetical protein
MRRVLPLQILPMSSSLSPRRTNSSVTLRVSPALVQPWMPPPPPSLF